MFAEHDASGPASRVVGDDHELEDNEHPWAVPRGEHEHDKGCQEGNVHGRKRRRHDVAHPRFLPVIEQTPRGAHEHRDVQSEEHPLATQPPCARDHADRTDVQRRDGQRNPHAGKRTSKFPDADKAHERNNTHECGKRREEWDCNSGNQYNRSRDGLRKVAPSLPRRPTRGMILTSGPRGKDAGEERTIS